MAPGAGQPGGADGALPVSILEIGALLRRHFIAVLAVLVLALWLVHDFKAAPMVYNDSATVVFKPPVSQRYRTPTNRAAGASSRPPA